MQSKEPRRQFLKKAGLSLGAALALPTALHSCNTAPESSKSASAPAVVSQKTFEWRAVTTWPPNFPVLGEAVNKLAAEMEVLSNGRLKIKVYGAGELVPALEIFDAVALGGAEIGHGAAYYWAGKIPAAVFFGAIPFGMNAQQLNAWLLFGGGWELWQELYGKFGLYPIPCGNTGVQMGGWFNKQINTAADLSGLKMRIPGLGGKVIAKAGGAAVTMAGGEIYTNLERGVIDATEWIGPYHDYLMGFHEIAKYYYYPGWHEPAPALELFCNLEAYNALPKDLQQLFTSVVLKYNQLILSEFEAKNNFYLKKILAESKVELRAFPEEVMTTLQGYTQEVLDELIASDDFSRKVYESYRAFKTDIKQWNRISEQAIAPYL